MSEEPIRISSKNKMLLRTQRGVRQLTQGRRPVKKLAHLWRRSRKAGEAGRVGKRAIKTKAPFKGRHKTASDHDDNDDDARSRRFLKSGQFPIQLQLFLFQPQQRRLPKSRAKREIPIFSGSFKPCQRSRFGSAVKIKCSSGLNEASGN